MSKLAGTTLAGILLITVTACHTQVVPPTPAPLRSGGISLTTSATLSARTCDATPQQPTFREGATVTFSVQPGHNYSIRFANGTPFTTGGPTPPISNGVTYITGPIGSAKSITFPYVLLDEGNCHAASQYIGIIVTH